MQDVDDGRLVHEVERALGRLPGVNLANVRVTADRARVRLVGVVPTLAEKQSAIDAAYGVQGVVAVDEAIAVETPDVPRDPELSRQLGEALDQDEDVDAVALGAQGVQGQARMVGSAASIDELRRGIDTAGGVTGPSNVIDSAQIDNPYGADRVDLVNAAADALREHPVLRTRPIRAVLEGTGKLVLAGQVRTEAEKTVAIETIAAVPGVHSVREELDVIP